MVDLYISIIVVILGIVITVIPFILESNLQRTQRNKLLFFFAIIFVFLSSYKAYRDYQASQKSTITINNRNHLGPNYSFLNSQVGRISTKDDFFYQRVQVYDEVYNKEGKDVNGNKFYTSTMKFKDSVKDVSLTEFHIQLKFDNEIDSVVPREMIGINEAKYTVDTNMIRSRLSLDKRKFEYMAMALPDDVNVEINVISKVPIKIEIRRIEQLR